MRTTQDVIESVALAEGFEGSAVSGEKSETANAAVENKKGSSTNSRSGATAGEAFRVTCLPRRLRGRWRTRHRDEAGRAR